MSDFCNLTPSALELIDKLSSSGGKQTISLTIEAAISQNQFILSLWQTFIITHTAIWTGLVTYKRNIPVSYIAIASIPYVIGIYINGHSLYDAYNGLEALYSDIKHQVEAQKIQDIMPNLYNYYSINRGLAESRAKQIILIYSLTFILTFIGVGMHYRHNKKINFPSY